EGRTIAIEYRWAEGREERYHEIAAEFVRLKVDAILTQGTQAAMAAKQATSMIPIVATVVGDPVGSGLVTSLALPGGNVTGLSVVSPDARGHPRFPSRCHPGRQRQSRESRGSAPGPGSRSQARPWGLPDPNPARRGHRIRL